MGRDDSQYLLLQLDNNGKTIFIVTTGQQWEDNIYLTTGQQWEDNIL